MSFFKKLVVVVACIPVFIIVLTIVNIIMANMLLIGAR